MRLIYHTKPTTDMESPQLQSPLWRPSLFAITPIRKCLVTAPYMHPTQAAKAILAPRDRQQHMQTDRCKTTGWIRNFPMDEQQPASRRDEGYPRPINGLTYRWMIAVAE